MGIKSALCPFLCFKSQQCSLEQGDMSVVHAVSASDTMIVVKPSKAGALLYRNEDSDDGS